MSENARRSKRRTPKQVLLSHIINDHRRRPAKSWTMKQLVDWHSETHHQYTWSHHHGGMGRGPNERPPGWQTGEDVIWTRASGPGRTLG